VREAVYAKVEVVFDIARRSSGSSTAETDGGKLGDGHRSCAVAFHSASSKGKRGNRWLLSMLRALEGTAVRFSDANECILGQNKTNSRDLGAARMA